VIPNKLKNNNTVNLTALVS